MQKKKKENKDDRLLEVKPLLDAVWANCLKIEPEQITSYDEQTIPAKTKQSGSVRQYNPKKKKQMGFQEPSESWSIGYDLWFFDLWWQEWQWWNPLTTKDIVLKLSKDSEKWGLPTILLQLVFSHGIDACYKIIQNLFNCNI